MHLEQGGEPHNYTIGSGKNQITIETVENEKDIGVTIDKELRIRIQKSDYLTNKNLGIFRTFAFMDKRFCILFTSLDPAHFLI